MSFFFSTHCIEDRKIEKNDVGHQARTNDLSITIIPVKNLLSFPALNNCATEFVAVVIVMDLPLSTRLTHAQASFSVKKRDVAIVSFRSLLNK